MYASAISKPALSTIAVLFLCSAANALQSASSTADLNTADLDAIVQRVIAQERVVGASVLVARGDKILLHKGYGFADLALEAPTKDKTVYHIVGPMLPFTGIAVMQQVERGKVSLDDDISKFIPEFPLQGHHVTVRQLLNHTSGIVDYHYLGDPIEATSRQPKALDEVMALYAGKNWSMILVKNGIGPSPASIFWSPSWSASPAKASRITCSKTSSSPPE